MMASNLISRLLPPREGSPSVYETLQQQDATSEASDLEERAGMSIDEENLGARLDAYDLEHAGGAGIDEAMESAAFLAPSHLQRREHSRSSFGRPGRSTSRGKSAASAAYAPEVDDGDDEVPASLLIEGDDEAAAASVRGNRAEEAEGLLGADRLPAPPTPQARLQWEAAQSRARRRQHPQIPETRGIANGLAKTGLTIVDPKERAMWKWANVENLDNFLKDVYNYYLGNGIWCIMLSRILNLLTLSFVVGFSTFLSMCVDYKKVPESRTMSQVLISQCIKKMPTSANIFLWLFTFFWIAKVFEYALDISRLKYMHDFYLYLLDIRDADIQTISWQEVVARLMALRDSNPVTAEDIGPRSRRFMGNQSKQRMDAHDIANRLMRKENYLIALFNKDILDLTLPIPFLRNRELFSKALEWNLTLCIIDYVFNEQGQVRPLFLKDTHRRALSDGLRRRFIFAGVMNVICAPFIVIYLVMLYFFRYFTEFQKNPSQIGSRQYTPLAEWKFREFNELWHLFQRRINMSYPFASRYVDQFPKDKTTQISRFVAFVTGALAAVLAVSSILDPELFLGFELTPERTVLFYLGVFGSVWAIARGVVPEENLVFDPEYALNEVTEYTHYMPAQWKGRLHSDEVKREFSIMYQMKVVIFIEEILSIIFTPFVLWFSLPKCSDRVIDFFREFTVHVDGLGYVCSFAVFDFKKGATDMANAGDGQRPELNRLAEQQDLREEYYSTKDGKMLASYFGFLDNYANTKNPRTTIHHMHPGRKRNQFNPPPAFHGLRSPTKSQFQQTTRSALRQPTSTATGLAAAARQTPRTRGAAAAASSTNMQMSLLPSILLDPQHQPSASGFRTAASRIPPASSARKQTLSPTSGAGRRNLLEENPLPPLEDEDSPEHSHGGLKHPAPSQTHGHHMNQTATTNTSSGIVTDSNLGESWKTATRGAGGMQDEDDAYLDGDDDEDVDVVTGEKAGAGAGVLGLLYQFQKATAAEGRGAGVNI